MTFHQSKRRAVIALAASCLVLCMASPPVAQAEGSASEADAASDNSASKEGDGKQGDGKEGDGKEGDGKEGARKNGGGEEKKPRNSIRLSAAYAHHLLRHRDSQTTGEPLKTREDLGGFEIAYERELIDEHLSIELAKPFFFSADSVESPFEVTLKGLFVKGSWEGYIGAILTFNIRFLSSQRAEVEGRKNILSFGVGGTIGGAYHFTEHWSLELGFDYAYVPTDPVVSHEFDFALGGVYHF